MRSKLKKITMVLLMLVMLLGISTISVAAANTSPSVSTSMEAVVKSDVGNQIYKLVISVNSSRGVSLMSTTMSYDNEVIIPVHNLAYADLDSYVIGNPDSKLAHKVLLSSTDDCGGKELYDVATAKWVTNGSRTAVLYELYSTTPITSMVDSQYEEAFAFYFRLADGKDLNDMNVGTFKIETDKSDSSFLKTIFPEAIDNEFGIKVVEVTPEDEKIDGSNISFSYPSEINLTLTYENSDKKITPDISTWPTPSEISYGETLEDSSLTGGSANVAGEFTWSSPNTKPTVSDGSITDYSVIFNPADTATYNSVTHTTGLKVTVNKAKITEPVVVGSTTYTGDLQLPDIAKNDAYTISASGINAGDYTAIVTLDDKANYEWAGGGDADLSLDWSIAKKTLVVGDGTYDVSKTYDGTTNPGTATGSLALGGIVNSEDVTAKVLTVPDYPSANAGIYTLTLNVSLDGSDAANYELASTTYVFTKAEIFKDQITKPSATGTLIYDGTPQSPTIPLNAAYTIRENTETNAGNYAASVSLNDKANYEWDDSSNTDLSLDWSIAKADSSVAVSYTGVTIYSSSPLPTLTVAGTPGLAALDSGQTLSEGTNNYNWTFTPTDTTNFNGKTGTISLTVIPVELVSIAVTTEPTDKDYEAFEVFESAGMTIMATYNDSNTKDVTDKCIISYDNGANYFLAGETNVTVTYTEVAVTKATTVSGITVLKVKIAKPIVTGTLIYDGTPQSPTIEDNAAYAISGNIETNAGDYMAIVALNDKANYEWDDSSNTDLSLDWSIAKADSSVAVSYTGGTIYTSSPLPALTVAGTPGSAVLDSGQTLSEGTNNYNWTFTPTDTTNFNGETGTISLQVEPVLLTSITVTTPPTKTDYDAFESFDSAGLLVTGNYNDGTSADVTSQVTYSYENGSNVFNAGETYIDINFGGKTVRESGLTVAKLQVPKAIASSDLTYNANPQSPTIAINAEYTISGNTETNAGNYAASVVLNDNLNYEWDDGTTMDLSLPWSIAKKTLVVGDGTYAVSKTYDGTTNSGTATGSLALAGIVNSEDVTAKVLTVPDYPSANAGVQNLTLNVSLDGSDSANYVLDSPTYVFTKAEIYKAQITKPSATGTFTYDGTPQSPTIEDNAAYAISGNIETNAGDYMAIVALNDKANYEWDDSSNTDLSLDWSIAKADSSVAVSYTGGTIYSSSPLPALTVAGTPGSAVLDSGQTLSEGTNNYNWTFTPTDTTNFNGETGTISLSVVLVKLDGITVTIQPTNKSYVAFQAFDPTGMIVTATYNDSKTKVVTDQCTIDYINDSNTFRAGETSVTIVLAQDSIIKTAVVDGITVAKVKITKPTVTGALTYNSNSQSPTITEDDSYTIGENVETAAGNYTASVVLNDKNNYEWNDSTTTDLSLPWSIAKKDLSVTAAVAGIPDKLWTGNSIEPTVTVTDGGKTLVEDTDYDVAYTSNTNPGTATVTITFKGNYTGVKSVTFTIINKAHVSSRTIVKADITDPAIEAHLVNEGKYTVETASRLSANTNEFTIDVKGIAPLTSYESSNPLQGSGEWIGIILGEYKINDGPAVGTTDIYYSTDGGTYTQLTAADLTEVQSVGGVDGEFILWLKSEEIGAGIDRYIASDLSGLNATKLTVNFTAYVASSSSSKPVVPAPVIEEPVTSGATTTVTTAVTPTTKGTKVTGTISSRDMDDAVNAALEASESQGTTPNVTLEVTAPAGSKNVTTNIPKASVEKLIEGNTQGSATIDTSIGTLTFDGQALSAINSQATGVDIEIAIENIDKETLTPKQKNLVGDNPVIDLSVRSGNKVISDFNGGAVKVSIPYILSDNQDPNNLVVWFVDDEGNLKKFESTYSHETGEISFVTDHFSKYVIAYFPFEDITDNAWYYKNIAYVYMNDLMNGTSATKFSPKDSTTRGMVVTVLWRMEGEPSAEDHSFKDVHSSWYQGAISWASENGIVTGYGDDRFGPDDLISREQMAKIIYQYGIHKEYDMTAKAEINNFADADSVSKWAYDPIRWAIGAGIINGTGENKISPVAGAERAQVAAILQRFIENTVQ